MFVKNARYNADWDYLFTQSQRNSLSQAKGALVARKIAGERVVLYRRPSGQVVALEDRCVHRQAALSLGQKEGANYRLEIANLADLTHLAWVHQGTLGAPDSTTREQYTHIKPTFTLFPNAMRTEYAVRKSPISTFLAHLFPTGTLFDLHFDIMHTIPCTWVLHFRVHVSDGGTEGLPTGPLVADTWTSQAVTPNDAESVDYYYSWGAARHCEFPGLSELLRDNLDDAFTEDRHVLEAQHVRVREKPGFQTISIIHDVGPSKMLRLLDQMLRREADEQDAAARLSESALA